MRARKPAEKLNIAFLLFSRNGTWRIRKPGSRPGIVGIFRLLVWICKAVASFVGATAFFVRL
jgi:hypothetical protein